MTEPEPVSEPAHYDRHTTLARIWDNIDELIQPRTVRNDVTLDDDMKPFAAKGSRKRVPRTHTLPSLLRALEDASNPGADMTQLMGARNFESRPAARLDPIRVRRHIEKEARKWCDDFDLRRSTPTGFLSALKGHSSSMEDAAVRRLDKAVTGWRRMAREAVGEDPVFVLYEACPECWNKNCITVRCERHYDPDSLECVARCSKCKKEWPTEMLGLLRQQIEYNVTQETMTDGG